MKEGNFPAADFSGKRFLVAEDMEVNREIAAEYLRKTGAAVEFAEEGRRCVEMISLASFRRRARRKSETIGVPDTFFSMSESRDEPVSSSERTRADTIMTGAPVAYNLPGRIILQISPICKSFQNSDHPPQTAGQSIISWGKRFLPPRIII